MSPSTGSQPPRWLWAVVVALAGLAALYPSHDDTLWFHLGAGRSIAEHGLPARETWCLAARGGEPWHFEWLFNVALHHVHRLGGEWGVALWRVGWAAAAMGLVVRLLFVLGATGWAALCLAPLTIAVVRDRLLARPEPILIVFVLAALVLFETARRTGRDRTRWLIPLQVLGSNLHGSWVFATVVAWTYAATSWLAARFRPRPAADEPPPAPSARPSRAVLWAILGLVLWAASAVVPSPLQTLAQPSPTLLDIGVDPRSGTMAELREWSWGYDRFEPFTALLGLWVLALVVGGSRLWQAAPGLTLVAFGSFTLAVLELRFRGLAAWVGMAPLAVALAPRGPVPARRALALLAAAAGLIGAWWLVVEPGHELGVRSHPSSMPVRAAALAESLGLEGAMFNSVQHGGYLLWARGNKNPPLLDVRRLGSPAFRSLYARAHLDPTALDSLIEVWDFNYLLVAQPTHSESPLITQLAQRPEWGLIFYDDGGLLFVRWNRYPELARARAYRYLTADAMGMVGLSERARADSGLGRLLDAELRRAREESPYHSRASLWLGLMALGRDDAATAVQLFDDAERIDPAMPGLALRQGVARERAGDLKGALEAYRRALREPDDRVIAEGAIHSLEP